MILLKFLPLFRHLNLCTLFIHIGFNHSHYDKNLSVYYPGQKSFRRDMLLQVKALPNWEDTKESKGHKP